MTNITEKLSHHDLDLSRLTDAEKDELFRLLTMPPETRFAKDPVGWAVEVLGVPEWSLRWSLLPEYANHVWDGTPDPIAAMMDAVARGDRKIAVESATGTGKTYAAAILVLWFLACFKDSLVVTIAPKEDQLTALLWKEIGRQWPKFKARYPMASTVKLKVRMLEAEGDTEAQQELWTATGWVVGTSRDEESASKARGFHAEHMLLVIEETTGVATSIMKSLAATCTATHNIRLALGNPDHQQDTLHQFAVQDGTTFVRASAYDHPNVVLGNEIIPGSCSRASLEDFASEYGIDTPMYASKARGICPDQSKDALIRSDWIERAFKNYENPDFHVGLPAFGVDVAQSETGRDKAALAYGTGAALHEIRTEACDNADVYGERVVMEAQQRGIRPQHVGVDVVGVGSNVINAGKRLGYKMVALQSAGRDEVGREDASDVEDGQKPITDSAECLNLRARMWWQLRADLMHDRLAIKRNDSLKMDLLAVEWERKNGKIVVKSKELIRDDIGRSTDEGDSCCYWNWVRDRRQVQSKRTTPKHGDEKMTFGTLFKARRSPSRLAALGITESV